MSQSGGLSRQGSMNPMSTIERKRAFDFLELKDELKDIISTVQTEVASLQMEQVRLRDDVESLRKGHNALATEHANLVQSHQQVSQKVTTVPPPMSPPAPVQTTALALNDNSAGWQEALEEVHLQVSVWKADVASQLVDFKNELSTVKGVAKDVADLKAATVKREAEDAGLKKERQCLQAEASQEDNIFIGVAHSARDLAHLKREGPQESCATEANSYPLACDDVAHPHGSSQSDSLRLEGKLNLFIEKLEGLEAQLQNLPDLQTSDLQLSVGTSERLERLQEQCEPPPPVVVKQFSLMWSSSVYVVEESIWELLFFLGLEDVMSIWDSLMLALCFLANVLIQYFVCTVLWHDAFQEEPFPEKFLNDMQAWRLTDAHRNTYADPVLTASLASRVCSDDSGLALSTNQQNLYLSLEAYMNSGGAVLALAAIVVWTCCCAGEMRKCVSFLCACLNVPHSGVTTLRFDGQQWVLESIAHCRVFCGVLVFAARIAIAGNLLCVGCRWLAYTTSVEELLLNASALAFVMNIDEFIYQAFVPLHWYETLRNLKPLEMSAKDVVAHFAPHVLLILTVGLAIFSNLVFLSPLVEVMKDVQLILCSGEKDFVFGVDAFQQMTWTRTAPYGESSLFVEGQQFIVNALIQSDSDFVEKVSVEKATGRRFNLDVTQTQREFAARLTVCGDYTGENLGMLLWSVSGDRRFYNASLATCQILLQEFPMLCESRGTDITNTIGTYVRYQCPVSCGCNDASSGLFVLGIDNFGCPLQACKQDLWLSLANNSHHGKCEDMAPRQLQTNAFWQRFARIAADSLELTQREGARDILSPSNQVSEAAANLTEAPRDQISMLITELGCSFLPLVRSLLSEQLGEFFCMNYHHGASFYCPEACGCSLADIGLVPARDRCPASCFESSA